MAGSSARVIQANERVCVCGRTGSGKSWLTQLYLAGYQNVIALDTKGDSDGPNGAKKFWPSAVPQPKIIRKLADLAKVGGGRYIYRPGPEEMNLETYEALFRWIYERKNTILWIDEVYSVVEDGGGCPFWLKALLTRGRSRGIGVWSCTQRPKFVPNEIFSESEHHFVFRLLLEDDRAKCAGWIGKEVMQEPPGKHGFWYWSINTPRPILVPQGLTLSQ